MARPVKKRSTPARRAADARRRFIILGGISVVAAIFVAALVLIVVQSGSSSGSSAKTTAVPTIDVPRNGTTLGYPDAPVTINEYADYQCPYCGEFARNIQPQVIQQLVATKKAKLVFHDYAFIGQESLDAAVGALCADQQGKFWEYHDTLFANQDGENRGTFSPSKLRGFASRLGLDMTKFDACFNSADMTARVMQENQAARALGVQATPTFFVGNQVLRGVPTIQELVRAVNQVAGAAPPTGTPAGK